MSRLIAAMKIYEPNFLGLQAEAYAAVGDFETGLRLLEEAQIVMATTEVRFDEAELYLLKGELYL